MVERVIRTVAIVASLLVVAGWGLFAIDESRAASQESAAEVAGREATRAADPTPDVERAREAAHGRVREGVDDANDLLLRPFAVIVDGSPSQWVRRTIPAMLALVLYGFGLGIAAKALRRGSP